jgi:KUP system potassium uptake protein
LSSTHEHPGPHGRYLAILSITALGVVFGDIGTSPLYALRECFSGEHGMAVTPDNVLGILSLVFWSLVIVISIKYIVFILRADNRGEGGILALTALITPTDKSIARGRLMLILMGIFGAALLYGDGMITPAISVLSAVEGLQVATPFFRPYLIPITVAILIGLFAIQNRGTAKVGAIFGPITLLWFLVLALLGLWHIFDKPGVLAAVNPMHGVNFFVEHGWRGFLVLGSVVLVVTGGEALYADMGHFGTRPIRAAWFFVVFPALLLNYFGQGALLISDPTAAENPFYRMAPDWALYPMVALATMATVIASQALISGAYSLTMQAVQLGYSPRLDIDHTSAREMGQIYIPAVNWTLMIACIGLVIGFRESSNLAAAYGIAVTATMSVTTILFYLVARDRWHWNRVLAMLICGFFLVIDLSFFAANATKILHGGWFPLLIAAGVFTLMSTWKTGRRILRERMEEASLPLTTFLESIKNHPLVRVPGTAVFMFSDPVGTPPALLHNLKHNKILHERNVVLRVETQGVPHLPEEERVVIERLPQEFYRIALRYGFMEEPNIPAALKLVDIPELKLKPMETSFFLGRETLFVTQKPGMAVWREKIFIWMSRNARSASHFFGIPPNRVVELGTQVEL